MSASSSEITPLHSGKVIAGKYSLLREIGRGGVGLVFEAEHIRLRQRVAIKVLAPHLRSEADVVTRFEREARAMGSLKSPHIATVFDVDTLPDGTPYMVMELLEGRDLHRHLREQPRMSNADIVSIVTQACEGLAVVHASGIIHRDLKPSNLFLTQAPSGGYLVKVMDFGISKLLGDEVTHIGSSLGTPAYMSPEQIRASSEVDARSDIWALGVLLFRALSGTLPFDGEGITGMSVAVVNEAPKNLTELRPDLPPELVKVVERLLEKDPSARYQTVAEVREALQPFGDDTSQPPSVVAMRAAALEPPSHVRAAQAAVTAPRVEAPLRTDRGAPGWIWIVALGIALGLGAIVALMWRFAGDRASAIPPASTVDAPKVAPTSPEPPSVPTTRSEATPPATDPPAPTTPNPSAPVHSAQKSVRPVVPPKSRATPPARSPTPSNPASPKATAEKSPELPNLL
jgi:serine/threonine-protein kinase